MIEWIKAEWVAELRNPERVQGNGLMLDGNGRQCCLGVLCDVAVRHGIIPPPEQDSRPGVNSCTYDGCSTFPSPSVVEWAEMTSENPSVPYNGHQDSLSFLNDTRKLTFPEIAALIEEYL